MKQLLVPIAALLVAAPALSLEYTDVTSNVAACNSSIPMMISVTAKGCVPCTSCEEPSDLICNYNEFPYAHFNYTFIPSEDAEDLDMIASFNSQTEYGGALGAVIQHPCYRGLKCPLKAGHTYSYNMEVELKNYHKRYQHKAIIRNEKKEYVACVEYWTTILWTRSSRRSRKP